MGLRILKRETAKVTKIRISPFSTLPHIFLSNIGMSNSQHLTPNNVTPTMVLSDTNGMFITGMGRHHGRVCINISLHADNVMEVPEFPARNGPQRLVAAATKQPKRRQKVILEPGHSPLDWARLKSSGKNLRVRDRRTPQRRSMFIKPALLISHLLDVVSHQLNI